MRLFSKAPRVIGVMSILVLLSGCVAFAAAPFLVGASGADGANGSAFVGPFGFGRGGTHGR